MEYTRAYRLSETPKLIAVNSASNPKIRLDLGPRLAQSWPTVEISEQNEPSLFSEISNALSRSETLKLDLIVKVTRISPNEITLKKWIDEVKGDPVRLAEIRREWEIRTTDSTIEAINGITVEQEVVKISFSKAGDELLNTVGTLVAELHLDLPTRGDLPITAFYVEGPNRLGDEVPIVTWTDRSGRESSLKVQPNVIYPIQPTSIMIEGLPTIVLLA